MAQFNGSSSFDDAELPDPSDMDQESDDTDPCPYCRKPIHEQSDFCHHCGKFISREDEPKRTPIWLLAGGVVCLAIVVVIWMW